ncbi:MAG: PhzF family phenazine biosynthesis protein [Acidobacteriota bacterium]
MAVPIYQVDAFTSVPFKGNPAAVCLLEYPQPEDWMQNIAAEMNLAETAFVLPREGAFDLRWFTPTVEVPLCGHATLAGAHILWETETLPATEPARFHTLSGLLTATKSGEQIELDFPAISNEPASMTDEIRSALGVEPRVVRITHTKGRKDPNYLLELESEDVVRGLMPDFNILRKWVAAGIIITARSSSSEVDFVSRYFAANVGIDEDPVTGSAHCVLAPYWSEILGKAEMIGYQASARGGLVGVRMGGDRVYLSGEAVTILRGVLSGEPVHDENGV